MRVTNYRKDGSSFVNVLTIHPVHDSDNEYRFSIGILSDLSQGSAEGDALERLRGVLPSLLQQHAPPRLRAQQQHVSPPAVPPPAVPPPPQWPPPRRRRTRR